MQFLKKIKIFKDTIRQIENWHIPIKYYLGMSNKEDIICFKNGIKCIIRNKSDSIAFFENYFLKVNNPNEEFEIKKDDIVIDIGAHIGYFTIYAANKAEQGIVYSIEPYKESLEILKKNLKLNNLTNIESFHAAISKITESVTLFIDKNNQIGNSIFQTDETTESEKVNSFSLGDFVKNNEIKKIDFLKMDCEGAEFEILLNLDKELIKKINKISVEVHENNNKNSLDELVDFLSKNNFKVSIYKLLDNSTMKLSMLYAKNLELKEIK
jgi:FkbM family methyltransferase